MKRHLAAFIVAAGLLGGAVQGQEAGTEEAAREPLRVDQPLYLSCKGNGVAVFALASTFRSPNPSADESGRSPYEGTLEIQLFTGRDRIRPPEPMASTPFLSNTGWYSVRRSHADDRAITAVTSINMFNTHQIRIDRFTNTIEISAPGGTFSGVCRKVDPEAEKPKL